MKPADILLGLEKLAKARGIKVSYESLSSTYFKGGLCSVRGKYRIIVDKRQGTSERVNVVAESLSKIGLVFLEEEDLSEEVVAIINDFKQAKAS